MSWSAARIKLRRPFKFYHSDLDDDSLLGVSPCVGQDSATSFPKDEAPPVSKSGSESSELTKTSSAPDAHIHCYRIRKGELESEAKSARTWKGDGSQHDTVKGLGREVFSCEGPPRHSPADSQLLVPSAERQDTRSLLLPTDWALHSCAEAACPPPPLPVDNRPFPQLSPPQDEDSSSFVLDQDSASASHTKAAKRKRKRPPAWAYSFSWLTNSPTSPEGFKRELQTFKSTEDVSPIEIQSKSVELFSLWKLVMSTDISNYSGWSTIGRSLELPSDFFTVCTLRNHYVTRLMGYHTHLDPKESNKKYRTNTFKPLTTTEDYGSFEKELFLHLGVTEVVYPLIDGQFVDPLHLYSIVHFLGGHQMVEYCRQWKSVTRDMKLSKQSNPQRLKQFYFEYLSTFRYSLLRDTTSS